MTRFGQMLIQSAEEALAIAKGEAAPARVYAPLTIDVVAIRKQLGLSQQKFVKRFGLSAAMARDWDQKRRNPDQAARMLLTVIAGSRRRWRRGDLDRRLTHTSVGRARI